MIDIQDLRMKQAEFEGTRQEFKKDVEKLETERKEFIKRFPESKLKDLSVQEYAIGTDVSDNSFCYLIENSLQGLGNIHGATAFKFGIYYGKIQSDATKKYRFTSKFGDSESEAFQNVKIAIMELLKLGKEENIEGIRQNPLSPMFKGKILSTYYPDKFLNIFADEHLSYFLDKLDLLYGEDDDEINKRLLLKEFKNNDVVMSRWTIYEFSKFLYYAFGRPPKKEEAVEELREYIESRNDYPKMKEIKASYIELAVNPENIVYGTQSTNPKNKIVDFERENKINKLLGNRGEEIVFNIERKHLETIGKKELAKRVEWVSQKDDSLGYDILSYDNNGEAKYIEVKSTSQSPESNANFLISSNQYSKAKKLQNYCFYIVFSAKSKEPKIWQIKNPLQYENKGLTLTPISYRVIIHTNTSKK